MEQYDYVVMAKKDFMIDTPQVNDVSLIQFNVDNFNKELSRFGKEGYRVITKLYNAPEDWVLILSRPLVPVAPTRRTG